MIVVGGWFEVDPVLRDRFIAAHEEVIRRSRHQGGCLEFTFAPDPIEPGRVVLFERWTDQASLDAHFDSMRAGPPTLPPELQPTDTSVVLYDVAAERQLGS